MLTLEELKSRIKQLPEIDVLEILEINSEELVDRFEDKIDLKYENLITDFPDEDFDEWG